MSLEALGKVDSHFPMPARLAGFCLTLANCHNAESGQCNPKNEWLARRLECDNRTIRRHFEEAEKRGILKRVEAFVNGRQVTNSVTFMSKQEGTGARLGGDTSVHQKQEVKKQEKEGPPAKFVPDPRVDPKAWQEFNDHRNSSARLKRGWSDIAKTKACNILKQFPPEKQRALVNYSILGGYTGLFPDQLEKGQPKNGQPAQIHGASHKPFSEDLRTPEADKARAKADLARMEALIAQRTGLG